MAPARPPGHDIVALAQAVLEVEMKMGAIESILAREEEFYAAQTASDVARLDAIMSDRLRFVHTTGLVDDKATYLEAVRTGKYAHGEICRLQGQTRVFAGGAVTVGVIDMVSKPRGGTPVTMRIDQVLVWELAEVGWRLRVRQATRQPL
jgi:hypothetical protein